MKLATVVLGLLFSSYVASATMSASTLFGWLPSLFPLTNVFPLNLLPFPPGAAPGHGGTSAVGAATSCRY
ncbi:hypothetical protein MRX96_040947 [Rhipicephalus microplus]